MTPAICLAHHHNNDMLAASQIIIPSREQPGAGEALAAADLVGIGQCRRDAISLLGQKIRMALGDVPLPLVAELYLTVQIGAWKADHNRVTPRRR